jgi:hypothetical protein
MLKLKEFDDVRLVDPKRKKRSMTLYNLYLEDCGSIWLSGLFTGHQPSSTATKKSKKKGGINLFKPIRDLFKKPNALASQSNSNRGSIDSASGTHNSGLGNDAGPTEQTDLGKFIEPILVLSTRAQPFLRQQCHFDSESEYVPLFS